MNASSVDIMDILEDESSLGLTKGVNLFSMREPDKPSNCVTVFDTPGFPPMLTLGNEGLYEYPSIQIKVRNVKADNGWALIQDIVGILHGKNHEIWNNTKYELIKCSSGPALLDWDENNRVRFIINFNIQRKEA